MGYVIKKLPYKKRTWKLSYQDRTNKKNEWRHIPEEEYAVLGFSPSMTIEEAKARGDSLNAKAENERLEAARHAIHKKMKKEGLALTAYLNPLFVSEFEEKVLFGGTYSMNPDKKLKVVWKAAQKAIKHVKCEPKEWEYQKRKFYLYFVSQKWSPSYLKKVVPVINAWGRFLSQKQESFFAPLPYPTGRDREQIGEASFRETSNESVPLDWTCLKKRPSGLREDLFNWLYLSLWFGLRPPEVDSLRATARVETIRDHKVLYIYQSKLTSMAKEKRWKAIPCLEKEQLHALDMIKRPYKRPLVKTIAKYFGEGVNTYGGRKAFTDLMLSRGHKFEDISMWLGHTSIDRTWRNYKDRQKVAGI